MYIGLASNRSKICGGVEWGGSEVRGGRSEVRGEGSEVKVEGVR